MASFRRLITGEFRFIFVNRTKDDLIEYKLGPATGSDEREGGKVKPGDTVESSTFDIDDDTLEQGNVEVVELPDAPRLGFRFWSGSDGQYINVLGDNGYTTTKDNSEISEVTGHGYRVTVDGGGVSDPSTLNMCIQIYPHNRKNRKIERNLRLPDGPKDRPDPPYNDLDRYKPNLKEHQRHKGGDYLVEMTRHHIIPYNRLRDFWNTMLDRGDFIPVAKRLLTTLESNVEDYQMNIKPTELNQVRGLLRKIVDGQIRHDRGSDKRPDGFDGLAQIYGWLPGNLFIGPKAGSEDYNRAPQDDPGSNFESKADIVTGNRDFQKLERANKAIEQYLSNRNESTARRAISALLEIAAGRKRVYPLDSDNWRIRHKKYRLSRHNELQTIDRCIVSLITKVRQTF